jgi:hypothetical protein
VNAAASWLLIGLIALACWFLSGLLVAAVIGWGARDDEPNDVHGDGEWHCADAEERVEQALGRGLDYDGFADWLFLDTLGCEAQAEFDIAESQWRHPSGGAS